MTEKGKTVDMTEELASDIFKQGISENQEKHNTGSSALAAQPHEVSGMLLYAKTDETVLPDNSYWMSGNKISVKTLDLNCDFSEIANQLNRIIEQHFGIYKTLS